MRLGPHELRRPWMLAPMAGVSALPYRRIARAMGAGAAVTELVSAKGLVYGQERTRAFLRHDPDEQPFWVQLFGAEPEVMAEGAAAAARLGAQIIDINMGCPARKVTRIGAGSALMRDPDRAARIVDAVRRRTGLPVTAKIRSGWDGRSVNAPAVARLLEAAGCEAVAVHARTTAQGYSGEADWSVIAAVVRAVGIPVIGNGDVMRPADAHRMLAETGCAGVMIGRGALGNPWIFRQLATGDWREPSALERLDAVRSHLRHHVELASSERNAVHSFRPQVMWYARGLDGAASFRRAVMRVETVAQLERACEAFFARARLARDVRGREAAAGVEPE